MFSEEQFAGELAVLQHHFAQRLPAKLQHLQETWQLLLSDAWDSVTCVTLHRLIHNLAGTGASFGFTTLTETARALEHLFEAVLETGKPPSVEQRVQLQVLFDALHAASNNPDSAPQAQLSATSAPPAAASSNIGVMATGAAATEDLTAYLRGVGYPAFSVKHVHEIVALP